MLQNKLLLISIIAILALLRFVYLPWYESQNVALEELQTLTKQLDKVQGLVKNRSQVEEELKLLEEFNAKQNALLLLGNDEQNFSLQIQKKWQTAMKASQVDLELFNWGLAASVGEEANTFKKQAVVRVSGSLVAIAKFTTSLETQVGVEISSFQLLPRKRLSALDKTTAVLNIDVLYRIEPS
jgi:L-lactate utilization protein LutC